MFKRWFAQLGKMKWHSLRNETKRLESELRYVQSIRKHSGFLSYLRKRESGGGVFRIRTLMVRKYGLPMYMLKRESGKTTDGSILTWGKKLEEVIWRRDIMAGPKKSRRLGGGTMVLPDEDYPLYTTYEGKQDPALQWHDKDEKHVISFSSHMRR